MSGRPFAVQVRDLEKSFRVSDEDRRSLPSRILHPVHLDRTRELKVLDSISFDIERGEFFGILGRNGSGKSTLIRLLASVYKADRGTIRVAGRVAPLIELGVGFDPELSARENVVLNGVMLGLSPATLRKRADAVMDFAEVRDFADMPLKNFSSGMQIRLAFAVLVEADADVLLVDEILAVGDAGFRHKCTEVFRQMQKDGKTIVLVTHDMHDVQQHCNRAMLLEAGRIETIGEPRQAIRRYFEVALQHRPGAGNLPDLWGDDGLSDKKGRSGAVRARIAKLQLKSHNGSANGLAPGSPIEVEALVDVERPLRAAGLRMEIRSQHEARVFAPPDSATSVRVTDFEPGQRMRIEAQIENRLEPGRYTLACAVLHADGGERTAASPVQALQFEVSGPVHPGAGLVSLGHAVKIGQAPADAAPATVRESEAERETLDDEWDFPSRDHRRAPSNGGSATGTTGPPAIAPGGDPASAPVKVFIPPAAQAGWRRLLSNVVAGLEALAGSAWFAYAAVLLVQLKVMWGIWVARDLTSGDSASYFHNGSSWAQNFELSPVFSPLYSFYYGSLQWFISDAYDITILHRVGIAIVASLLVLAVLRRLLPHGIALVLTLWWCLVPTNFDTLYEVHLFAVIPTLVAVIVALEMRGGLKMRSAVFGVLLLTTVLVRNEMLVALVAYTAVWLGYEAWLWRREANPETPRRIAAAVGIPAAIVATIVGLVLLSVPDRSTLSAEFDDKHRFNVCQVYALNYEQRHARTAGAVPYKACERWMRRDFDANRPTLTEAIRANPGAMADFFLLNVELIPYGLQALLFDRTSGPGYMTPTYLPIASGSTWVLLASLLLAGIVFAGLTLLWRERVRWLPWFKGRAWGWLVLLSLAATSIIVMITQRPRPSYLFNFTVLMLAVIGLSIYVIGSRWEWTKRLRALPPAFALSVLLLWPSHYSGDYETPLNGDRQPLKRMVERLDEHADLLRGGQTRLGAALFASEACAYVNGADPCVGYNLNDEIEINRERSESVFDLINDLRLNVVYADETLSTSPGVAQLLRQLEATGWRQIESRHDGDQDWDLLYRPAVAPEDVDEQFDPFDLDRRDAPAS